MAASAGFQSRRRARRGSLERPINGRMYRGTWLLVGLPLLAVVMGTIYATIAFRVFDGVVVDDYYRRGRAINRVLARDEAARAAGLHGRVALDASGAVTLALEGALAERPPRLRLRFLHATRAGADREAELVADGPMVYRGRVPPLLPGRQHLQLETDSWRLIGQLHVPGEAECALAPGD